MQPFFLFSSSSFSLSLFLQSSAISEIRLCSVEDEFIELKLWFFIWKNSQSVCSAEVSNVLEAYDFGEYWRGFFRIFTNQVQWLPVKHITSFCERFVGNINWVMKISRRRSFLGSFSSSETSTALKCLCQKKRFRAGDLSVFLIYVREDPWNLSYSGPDCDKFKHCKAV